MEFLTVDKYVALLVEELAQVEIPSAPARRIGVVDHIPSGLALIRRDLDAVAARARDFWSATDLARETASYLYAAGAPTPVWRRWAGLTGFGHLGQSDPLGACPYLVLGGEWECIAALRAAALGRGSPSARALWFLATGQGTPDELPDDDSVDLAWRELLTAVPAGDRAAIDAALIAIAEFWIAESEGDWEFFHPRSAPDFDPEPCAAAMLARRNGWSPDSLPEEVCRYLEAGLAEGEPEPLYPRLSAHQPTAAPKAPTTTSGV